ncbi:MAG: FAD-dependent oxidoreductase [Vicinamibacterales bacterium]
METLVLKVGSIRRATPSTRIVRLLLDGRRFPYTAGQAAMVGLATQPELVPYSIASAPEETSRQGYLEFLFKIEGGSHGAHVAGLKRGSPVAVEGPFGSFVFPPRPEEREFLFVAGGTGIAPLRAMICHAFESRQPGQLRLLYSARTPSDFAYLPELKRYARKGRIELSLTATREVPPRWRDGRGRITSDRLARLVRTPETLCFVCGPTAMVDDVPRMLLNLGIERRRIRVEEW